MRKEYEISNRQAGQGTLKSLALAASIAFALSACNGNGATKMASEDAGGLTDAATSAFKAATLSDAEVKDLSDKSCAAMDGKAQVAAAKSKEAKRLGKIIKGMPASVKGVPINYKVYLTKDVNAWAMNNGCVRVYSGLMAMMNDDEVRGVIGHEIGHVALGHAKSSMQTAYAASAARQAASSFGNAAVAALSNSELGELAETLVNSQFSQVQESASDDFSFDLLTAGKFKREGLVTAFEKLAKLGDNNSMLSSHPSSSGRAQHIRERIAAKK